MQHGGTEPGRFVLACAPEFTPPIRSVWSGDLALEESSHDAFSDAIEISGAAVAVIEMPPCRSGSVVTYGER